MVVNAGGAEKMSRENAVSDLITSLDSSAEDSAESVKGTAVLLWVQLGDVHK